jgi:hypothetical protein
MSPSLRYSVIAEFSWLSSEDIDKTSQLIYTLAFKPANFRSRSKMVNHYVATLVYLPSEGFQAHYVMLVLLREKSLSNMTEFMKFRSAITILKICLPHTIFVFTLRRYLDYRGQVLTPEVSHTHSQLP